MLKVNELNQEDTAEETIGDSTVEDTIDTTKETVQSTDAVAQETDWETISMVDEKAQDEAHEGTQEETQEEVQKDFQEETKEEVQKATSIDADLVQEVAGKGPAEIASQGTRIMGKRIKNAIETQEIFYGIVSKVQEISSGKQVMTVTLKTPELRGLRILVPRQNADIDFQTGDLFHLLGNEVPVIIIGRTKNKSLVGSRKTAQRILKEIHMEDISAGTELNATVLSFGKAGAFMSAGRKFGHVVGFMRNSDFSTDHMAVQEVKNIGDTVRVRCVSVDEKGRITWEAVKKVSRTERIVCMVEKGCSCEGVVKSITTFPTGDRIFVTIQKGLDASCLYPANFSVKVGDFVFLKIQDIVQDEDSLVPKVRAVVIKVK